MGENRVRGGGSATLVSCPQHRIAELKVAAPNMPGTDRCMTQFAVDMTPIPSYFTCWGEKKNWNVPRNFLHKSDDPSGKLMKQSQLYISSKKSTWYLAWMWTFFLCVKKPLMSCAWCLMCQAALTSFRARPHRHLYENRKQSKQVGKQKRSRNSEVNWVCAQAQIVAVEYLYFWS